jgi:GTPase SAR1 family protein
MFRLAQGVIIAFDLTKRETFEGVKVWADCIYKQSRELNIPKVLVGNKLDLADGVTKSMPSPSSSGSAVSDLR